MKNLTIKSNFISNQSGVSLIVALVMLLLLTLIGVSSMNVAVMELKMANSMQQSGMALNSAEESLKIAEDDIDTIITTPAAFDFSTADDSYYLNTDNINVHSVDWSGLTTKKSGANDNDVYVTEYIGFKAIPGESIKYANDGRIVGGAVHTFRITTRSEAAKNAVRLVQSIYVSLDPP